MGFSYFGINKKRRKESSITDRIMYYDKNSVAKLVQEQVLEII